MVPTHISSLDSFWSSSLVVAPQSLVYVEIERCKSCIRAIKLRDQGIFLSAEPFGLCLLFPAVSAHKPINRDSWIPVSPTVGWLAGAIGPVAGTGTDCGPGGTGGIGTAGW